jgi:hypothetical protein
MRLAFKSPTPEALNLDRDVFHGELSRPLAASVVKQHGLTILELALNRRQLGLGKAAQLPVHWRVLGKGSEAWPKTYRQPVGVRT